MTHSPWDHLIMTARSITCPEDPPTSTIPDTLPRACGECLSNHLCRATRRISRPAVSWRHSRVPVVGRAAYVLEQHGLRLSQQAIMRNDAATPVVTTASARCKTQLEVATGTAHRITAQAMTTNSRTAITSRPKDTETPCLSPLPGTSKSLVVGAML